MCASCGRRLPPLPPRRGQKPGTGVQLPPRPATLGPRAQTSTSQPLSEASGVAARPGTLSGGRIAPTTSLPPLGPSEPAVMARAGTATQPPPLASAPEAVPAQPSEPAPLAPPPSGPVPAVPAVQRSPLARVARTGTTNPPPLASVPRAATTTSPPPLAPQATPPAQPPLGPRPASTTNAPPLGPAPGAAQPGVMVTSAGFVPVAAPVPGGLRPPAAVAPAAIAPAAPADDSARSLANALSPGPAAQRREPPPAEPRDPGEPSNQGRRRQDAPSTPPPAAAPVDLSAGYPRASADLMKDAGLPAALAIDATRARDDGIEPPPTRIHRPEALVDRPFTPPQVSPIPAIPEPGLVHAARYSLRFARARWQRRGAIKLLGGDIKQDTVALDQVLGALGSAARTAKLDSRVLFGENAAINAAEDRVAVVTREHNDVDARKVEENTKFTDIERERNTKLGEAERMLDEAQRELATLETQRRALRDKRKELERRQKAHLKAAEDADKQSSATELGDARQEHRRAAEQARVEAAALEPERQDVDRRLAAIERPISEASAKLDAAKAELDAAKRSLSDAREGHNHRLAELDAEQKRKTREISQAEAEIARRLVTLGTLVNLNRIEDPQFAELYQRIDRLRGAITARTTEIEKLPAEREAYDRGTLVRGVAVIGGAIVAFIALIVILRAILLH